MTTTKRTPGPWLVHSSSTLHMNDVQIASVYDHWRIVSHVARGPLDGASNANLIAASPDLLLACECVLQCADMSGAVRAMVQDAIAKARGEP